MTSLRVCSHNMHGYKQGEIFLKNNIFDIVLLQEHWLYPGSLNLLANIDNNYECNAVFFTSDRDIVSSGRPYGGLAALWKMNTH